MSSCNSVTSAASNAVSALNAGCVGAYPDALTPDALMIYLQTRLESLDGQINEIFAEQKKFEKLRSLLGQLKAELNKLNDKADPNQLQNVGSDPAAAVKAILKSGQAFTAGSLGKLAQAVANGPTAASHFEPAMESILDQIAELDPQLASQMRSDMRSEGQILYCEDGLYFSGEVNASKDYIDGLMKDTEASAQLNMIRLQSMMSSRQTAIQLSTNLVSALGESSKAIVSNIRA